MIKTVVLHSKIKRMVKFEKQTAIKASKALVNSFLIFALVMGVHSENIVNASSNDSILDNSELKLEQSNSYNLIKSTLSTSGEIGSYDTTEFSKKTIESLIQKVIDEDENRLFFRDFLLYSNNRVMFFYYLEAEEIESRKKETNDKADEIIQEIIQPNYTEYEKVKAVHDYIAKNTEYDIENFQKNSVSFESYTAYGSLIQGKAVCDGYTRAAKLMLDKLGIGNVYITGYINGEDGGYHSWNMVKLNGKYYHMDITWDDPTPNREGNVVTDYFLIDNKQLEKTRTWNVSDYPIANSGRW